MSEKQKLHIEKLANLRRGKKCPWVIGKKHSEETKKKISEKNKGKLIGRKRNPESILKGALKLRELHKIKQFGFIKGYKTNKSRMKEDNPNWRGGKLSEKRLLRETKEYKEWRKSVFSRDKYTCQKCGKKSKKGESVYMEAHHIKSFSEFPDLRFITSNGITLCKECHELTKVRKNGKYKVA